MNPDSDLESRLRRYRPAGPAPDLRERVLTRSPQVRRTWPWAVAAAALLAIAVGFGVAGGGLNGETPDEPGAVAGAFTDPTTLDALEHVYGAGLPVVVAYTASLVASEVDRPVAPPVEAEPWR